MERKDELEYKFTQDDDEYYRERFETRPGRIADRNYEDVRPAYQLGHIARLNPDYNGRTFDEVEPDLRHGWSNNLRARHGDWLAVRLYAEEAYNRNSSVVSREQLNRGTDEDLNDQVTDAR